MTRRSRTYINGIYGHNMKYLPGNRSGTMLILVTVALLLVTALAVGMLAITSSALYFNNRQQLASIALNLAESGAERGDLYLLHQSTPPIYNGETVIYDWTTLGSGSYRVTISGPVNPTEFLKTYVITSEGKCGGVSKKVEIVIRQSSFGRYAYFTSSETSSLSGGAIWWRTGETIDGPAHSNNDNGSSFNINYNGSTSPIFKDMLTAHGSSINYSPSRPRRESDFKRIYANGSIGFKLGVPRIPLPESTEDQREAAWGSTSGYPTTTGVYMRAGSLGGIYIVGDCAIQLALDSSGNQQVIITQTVSGVTKTTTVTIDKSNQTTSVTGAVGADGATSACSLPNGVIYATGNITSLKGTVADNLVENSEIKTRSEMTIATDVNSGKSITVTDNIKYNTTPDKTKGIADPVNLAAGTLGLVAKDITISSSAPRNLEIDAVCLAGGENTSSGSFGVANYNSKTPTGTLTVIGGIIQKARGAVGTFNSSTNQTMTGYAKNYKYDSRLASHPPPFYPTTGQYERISWRVLPDNE